MRSATIRHFWLCLSLITLLSIGVPFIHRAASQGGEIYENPATTTTIAGSAGQVGRDDGVGATARFNFPFGVALSQDNSFALISDSNNFSIRKLDLASGLVTTVAGNSGVPGGADGAGTLAEFNEPNGIDLSPDNTFAIIADSPSHTIRRFDLVSSQVTTIAGASGIPGLDDGNGNEARFERPYGIAVTSTFALITDSDNHTIRRLDFATNQVTTIAGTAPIPGTGDGTGGNALFNTPRGIALSPDGSYALIADSANHTIRRLNLANQQVTTIAGLGGVSGSADGPGLSARFNLPTGLSISNDSTVALVTDTTNQTIRKIDLLSGYVTTVAGSTNITGDTDGGGPNARFANPSGVAMSNDGTTALVISRDSHTVRLLSLLSQNYVSTPAGGTQGSADGRADEAAFNEPLGVALSPDGDFSYIADTENHTIRRLDNTTREVLTIAGGSGLPGNVNAVGLAARFNTPSAISLSTDGKLALIVDDGNNAVRQLDLASRAVTTVASGVALTGLPNPAARGIRIAGIALSQLEPAPTFALVTDSVAHTVNRVDLQSGAITVLAGSPGQPGFTDGFTTTATFNAPIGITLSADGTFALVADSGNNAVRRIDLPSGQVVTLAILDPASGQTALSARGIRIAGITLGIQDKAALITDRDAHTVVGLDVKTGRVVEVAGSPGEPGLANGVGRDARFNSPLGIAFNADGSAAFVADGGSFAVRKISTAAIFRIFAPIANLDFLPTPAPTPVLTCYDGVPVDADDSRLLELDTVLQGAITPAFDCDRYYFDGTAGQTILLRADASSNTLYPILYLYDPNGTLLIISYGAGGSFTTQLTTRLPATGRYVAMINGYYSDVAYTGPYQISLSQP